MRARVRVLLVCLLVCGFFGAGCWRRSPRHVQGLDLPGVHQVALPETAWLGHPIWSPDGSRFACVYQEGAEGRMVGKIYVLDLATGDLRLIEGTERGGRNILSWSSRSNEIAFNASGDRKNGIWAIDADGNEEARFLSEGNSAAWSPNGEQIAVDPWAFDKETQITTITVSILDVNTGESKTVFTRSGNGLTHGGLAWSPDGAYLALELSGLESKGSKENDIYTLDLATGTLHQLTKDGYNRGPTWSPDSRMIAYTNSDEAGNDSLVITRADGSCSVRPLGSIELIGLPAWSPDGRQIAFSYMGGIYLLDVAAVLGPDFLMKGPQCP